MHTGQKGHKPLGNQVTFDLIDIGGELRAVIAMHNEAPKGKA
jgi:hypothetical protein